MAAGEASGDALGASLVRCLQKRYPNAEFRGLTGEAMAAQGVQSVGRLSALHAFGLFEVLPKLTSIWALRKKLQADIACWRPDLVVTIDSPDFMLSFARHCRSLGIPVLHWVSPQVWAWRAGRVRQLAKSVDTLCCLLPFEPTWYRGLDLRAVFTGHPRAICEKPALAVPGRVVLAPGSRPSELRRLWPVFRDAAGELARAEANVSFIVACAPGVSQKDLPGLSATYVQGLPTALRGAQVALVASGTATLEIASASIPQVVAYRVAPSTYRLGKLLVRGVSHIALPNVLAGASVIPEHLQQLSPPAIAHDLVRLMKGDGVDQLRVLRPWLATLKPHGAVTAVADEADRLLN
ncbi:MAG: lipid-A-disaccharide synthase [Rhodobacterales bacterium]|nr:lipid-A-disaccharide synthase [Rhodobacterales bacterium]